MKPWKAIRLSIIKSFNKDACHFKGLSSEYIIKGKSVAFSKSRLSLYSELRLGRLTGLGKIIFLQKFNEILEVILELQKILDDEKLSYS